MPVTKQAKKRMRSDAQKHTKNQLILSRIKTLKKKNLTLTDAAQAGNANRLLTKELDKAASKGVIPKRRADRLKSRSAKRAAKLTATA